MRTLVFLIAAAALGTTASTALAETKAANDSPNVAEKKSSSEKLVCKRLPKSGSRMEERVCLTKQQWAKAEAEAGMAR